jgi:hypothetical protein
MANIEKEAEQLLNNQEAMHKELSTLTLEDALDEVSASSKPLVTKLTYGREMT